MNKIKDILNNEGGFALVMSMLIMVLLTAVGTGTLLTTDTDVKIAGNLRRTTQSIFVAEGGINYAMDMLRQDSNWGPDDANWNSQSTGTISLGSSNNGSYTIALYDQTGSNGRGTFSDIDYFSNLGSNDVVVEVTGDADGVSRRVAMVIGVTQQAPQFAGFSEGEFEALGVGDSPGKIIGNVHANDDLNFQGNYDLAEADATAGDNITPDCNSEKFHSCQEGVDDILAPVLDFGYYQNQSNFSTQQVFKLTPGVDEDSLQSLGVNNWTYDFEYLIETVGSNGNYRVTAPVTVVYDTDDKEYTHTVNWSYDINDDGDTDDAGESGFYTFTEEGKDKDDDKKKKKDDEEDEEEGINEEILPEKPFINAPQFNAYFAPTASDSYTSSVVNIFDTVKHLEFMGPPSGTETITATILVGSSDSIGKPDGKIDFEGGAGTLNLEPANGLAIVAEEVKFKSKYSSIDINVGTPTDGALILATQEFEVKGEKEEKNYTTEFDMFGSIVVGDGGTTTEEKKFELKKEGTTVNITYTPFALPGGTWEEASGTITVARREWREL